MLATRRVTDAGIDDENAAATELSAPGMHTARLDRADAVLGLEVSGKDLHVQTVVPFEREAEDIESLLAPRHGDEVVAAFGQRHRERGTDPSGRTGDERDCSSSQRPVPQYSNPAFRTCSGSRRLRVSTMQRPAICAATRERSSFVKSSHSVSTTSTPAPAHAS